MAITQDPIELIQGYDQWRKEVSQKDPDTSPATYVAHLQMQERMSVYAEAADTAVTQVEKLRELLTPRDGFEWDPEVRNALEAAVEVLDVVAATA